MIGLVGLIVWVWVKFVGGLSEVLLMCCFVGIIFIICVVSVGMVYVF